MLRTSAMIAVLLQSRAAIVTAQSAAPIIFRLGLPVIPNETLVISGAYLSALANITLCSVADNECVAAVGVQASQSALKLVIPDDFSVGVYNVTLTGAVQPLAEASAFLNLPEVNWWHSGSAESADTFTLDAPLRFFGRSLSFAGSPLACLPFNLQPQGAARVGGAVVSAVPSAGGNPITLSTTLTSCYRIDVQPSSLEVGVAYDFYVNNGLQQPQSVGSLGVKVASSVVALPSPPWPTAVFTVGTSPGCTYVSDCLLVAGSEGGGVVSVPPGVFYQGGGSQLVFPNNVALVGAGKDVTTILWEVGTGLPKEPMVTGNGTARWRVANVTIACYAAPQPGAQPALGLDFVFIGPGQNGVRIEDSALIYNTSVYPGIQIGNALALSSAAFATIARNTIVHTGNCAAQWPHNTAYYFSNVTRVDLRGNSVTAGCAGWSVASATNFLYLDNVFVSIGDTSEGAGFSALGAPPVLSDAYYGNNTQLGNPASHERWESTTTDGPGGAYNGSVTSSSINGSGSETLNTTGRVSCNVPGTCLAPGMLVAVMRGFGLGQTRTLVSATSSSITVDSPFNPPLQADSFVSVTGYRGRVIFEGSTYRNGTTFQFYGNAVDMIVSGLTLHEMFATQWENTTNVAPGLRVFGHDYEGGFEFNGGNVFEYNNLTCATIVQFWSDNIANITFATDQVLRNNWIAGAPVTITRVANMLVEHNELTAAYCDYAGAVLPAGNITVDASSTDVLVR